MLYLFIIAFQTCSIHCFIVSRNVKWLYWLLVRYSFLPINGALIKRIFPGFLLSFSSPLIPIRMNSAFQIFVCAIGLVCVTTEAKKLYVACAIDHQMICKDLDPSYSYTDGCNTFHCDGSSTRMACASERPEHLVDCTTLRSQEYQKANKSRQQKETA